MKKKFYFFLFLFFMVMQNTFCMKKKKVLFIDTSRHLNQMFFVNSLIITKIKPENRHTYEMHSPRESEKAKVFNENPRIQKNNIVPHTPLFLKGVERKVKSENTPRRENDHLRKKFAMGERSFSTNKINNKNNNMYKLPGTEDTSFNKRVCSKKLNINNIDQKVEESNLDCKVYKGKKSIELKAAVIEFGLGGFTCFSNKTSNEKVPTFLMNNINQRAFPIIKKFGGYAVFTLRDNFVNFVVLFPKNRFESYKKPFVNSFECAIELFHKLNKYLKEKEKNIKKPEKFSMGLDIGKVFLNINNEFKAVVPVSAVGKAINNAQRCEAHAKTVWENRREYRPIVFSEKLYKFIYKDLLLLNKWNKKPTERPFKGLLTGNDSYVYSIHESNIEQYYEKRQYYFTKKKPPLYLPLEHLIVYLIKM